MAEVVTDWEVHIAITNGDTGETIADIELPADVVVALLRRQIMDAVRSVVDEAV